jgi:hypothetical protein
MFHFPTATRKPDHKNMKNEKRKSEDLDKIPTLISLNLIKKKMIVNNKDIAKKSAMCQRPENVS